MMTLILTAICNANQVAFNPAYSPTFGVVGSYIISKRVDFHASLSGVVASRFEFKEVFFALYDVSNIILKRIYLV